MAVDVGILPRLHKYVLSPADDDQLKMAKLRYRLCVQEVAAIQSSPDRQTFARNTTLKSDDSGFEFDVSRLEYKDEGEEFCSNKRETRSVLSDDVYFNDTESASAVMSLSSTFESLKSKLDFDHAGEEFNQPMNGQAGFHKCTDFREALAVLTTRNKLANVQTRKTMLSRSTWKVAELASGPQKFSSVWQNSGFSLSSLDQPTAKGIWLRDKQDNSRKVNKEVEATSLKILEKEEEIADILRRILIAMEEEKEEKEEALNKEEIKIEDKVEAVILPETDFSELPSENLTDEPEEVDMELVDDAMQSPKPEQQEMPEVDANSENKPNKKKRRESIFRRASQAIRKRFSK